VQSRRASPSWCPLPYPPCSGSPCGRRARLIDEYGLDSSKVTWVVDDEEHVRELKLPPNVVHAPEGRALADMMAAGELSAGFDANAGIGRSGSPTGGWQQREANYPELFPNAEELEAAWYNKTGIYPMHGTIVVKGIVTTAATIASKPDLVHRFVAATVRGMKDAFADPAAAGAIMRKLVPQMDAAIAKDEAVAELAQIPGQPLGEIDPARIEATLEVVKGAFKLAAPVAAADVYAPGFVPK